MGGTDTATAVLTHLRWCGVMCSQLQIIQSRGSFHLFRSWGRTGTSFGSFKLDRYGKDGAIVRHPCTLCGPLLLGLLHVFDLIALGLSPFLFPFRWSFGDCFTRRQVFEIAGAGLVSARRVIASLDFCNFFPCCGHRQRVGSAVREGAREVLPRGNRLRLGRRRHIVGDDRRRWYDQPCAFPLSALLRVRVNERVCVFVARSLDVHPSHACDVILVELPSYPTY